MGFVGSTKRSQRSSRWPTVAALLVISRLKSCRISSGLQCFSSALLSFGCVFLQQKKKHYLFRSLTVHLFQHFLSGGCDHWAASHSVYVTIYSISSGYQIVLLIHSRERVLTKIDKPACVCCVCVCQTGDED